VTKWKHPGEGAVEKAGYFSAAWLKKPVVLEMAGPADTLAALRMNGTGKFLVVNFWATY
jgi:hypothetical protein